jgi:hypothetical protein
LYMNTSGTAIRTANESHAILAAAVFDIGNNTKDKGPSKAESRYFWLTVETVRRERRWTTAGATPARELVRSTR